MLCQERFFQLDLKYLCSWCCNIYLKENGVQSRIALVCLVDDPCFRHKRTSNNGKITIHHREEFSKHSFQKFITLYLLKMLMLNCYLDLYICYLNKLKYQIWYLHPLPCKMTFVVFFSFSDHLYKWLSITVNSTLFDFNRFLKGLLYTAKKYRH